MCLPGIDGVTDYDSPYRKYWEEEQYIPDIEQEYIVEYQEDGEIYSECFAVFEGDNEAWAFEKALAFAKSHDTLVFYQEAMTEFFHPKTGERVEEPAMRGKDYYKQPYQPYQAIKAGFIAIETDELPF